MKAEIKKVKFQIEKYKKYKLKKINLKNITFLHFNNSLYYGLLTFNKLVSPIYNNS